MKCPRCDSSDVQRLPPSQITPRPGYQCNDCGVKLRAPGTLPLYLTAVLLGGGLIALVAYVALGGAGARKMPAGGYGLGAMGLVCAGYALMQLARPVPRPD